MNNVNKALAAVFAVQAVLVLITLNRLGDDGLRTEQRLIPDFDAASVEKIEVFKSSDGNATTPPPADLVMTKANSIWTVTTHQNYPVDPDNIETFLSRISNLSSRGPLAEGASRQSQLHVTDTKYKRKIVVHRKNRAEPLILYLGKSAGGRKNAVRIHGEEEIHGVTGFTQASAQYAVLGWVNSSYLEVPKEDIVYMSVTNASGEYVVERDHSKAPWRLLSPPSQESDPAVNPDQPPNYLNPRPLDNIARQMANIKFNEPANPRIPRGSPLATITMGVSADPAAGSRDTYKVVIGPEIDGRYIVSRDNAPPVWIHINNFESMVNLTEPKLYTRTKPRPPGKKKPKAFGRPGGHGQGGMGGHGGQRAPHGQGGAPH